MTSTTEISSRIRALIDNAQPGGTQAQPFYCDDALFDLDMQKIVTRKWLLVDHVSRIPEPGHFFLYEVGSESIIIVRENDSKVNAFFNVCRHRGSLICLEPQGKRSQFTCPYHAWTYDLGGRLQGLAFRRGLKGKGGMPEDFDLRRHRLEPLRHRRGEPAAR